MFVTPSERVERQEKSSDRTLVSWINQIFYSLISTLVNLPVDYKIGAFNAVLKIGGTNIGGSDYRTSFGSPFVGQVYYISLLYNQLMN